jgi:hypothetical protein
LAERLKGVFTEVRVQREAPRRNLDATDIEPYGPQLQNRGGYRRPEDLRDEPYPDWTQLIIFQGRLLRPNIT